MHIQTYKLHAIHAHTYMHAHIVYIHTYTHTHTMQYTDIYPVQKNRFITTQSRRTRTALAHNKYTCIHGDDDTNTHITDIWNYNGNIYSYNSYMYIYAHTYLYIHIHTTANHGADALFSMVYSFYCNYGHGVTLYLHTDINSLTVSLQLGCKWIYKMALMTVENLTGYFFGIHIAHTY
jgi:hypothetical protein